MATILIKPVSVTSKGGWPVTITGISPTDHDCIAGEVTTPGRGKIDGEWNLAGTLRDGTHDGNLDINDPQIHEIEQLARQLGATY